jgi:hypothetical protein
MYGEKGLHVWRQLEHDTNNDTLGKYEYRLQEIVSENVWKSFVRLKDKSTPAVRKSKKNYLKAEYSKNEPKTVIMAK